MLDIRAPFVWSFRGYDGAATGATGAAIGWIRLEATPSIEEMCHEEAEPLETETPRTSEELIELVERTTAHNYHPLPVVVAEAEGCWVTDVEGKRYLDMLAAYSALNFGHRLPS